MLLPMSTKKSSVKDLNFRPPAPKAGALPNYANARCNIYNKKIILSSFDVNIIMPYPSLSANLIYKENSNVAYNNSFVEIKNDIRPLYAQASYLTNASDISVSLSANNINLNIEDIELKLNNIETKIDKLDSVMCSVSAKLDSQMGLLGFDFFDDTSTYNGNWTTVIVVSTAKFTNLNVLNSTLGNILNYEYPTSFAISGPITSIKLLYGSVLAYK